MVADILQPLFIRELEKLKTEILSYRSADNIWVIEKEISNSAGNLCLHLVGNLNTFIGAVLGNTGYIRNRELEFSLKNIPREKLVQQVDDTITMIENTLNKIPDEQLSDEYPVLVFAEKTTTGYFLLHLISHLTYHLGQINYHRRLLD